MKLLIREPDSSIAAELHARASEQVTSRLTYPEARAALAAARRDRRLSSKQLREGGSRLGQLMLEFDVIELEEVISTAAGELAERFALSGADAVHLASTLTRVSAAPVLATWDSALRRAAVATGLSVAP